MGERGHAVPKSQPPPQGSAWGSGRGHNCPPPGWISPPLGCFGKVKGGISVSSPGRPLLQRPENFVAGNEPKQCSRAWKLASALPSPPQPRPPQINVLLLFFNKALPDQMLTPVMIAQPAEGINSKSPFK